ncbi:MAG: hypothetical protein J5767_14595 [Paludibacteraceae bacterium]|nr:hypothetical protein [Paludibacteraceae bacterium]
MELIIISTKQEHYHGLVQRCCCTNQFEVEDREEDLVPIKYIQSGDYSLCILPVTRGTTCSEKASYSLDLVKKTIEYFFKEQVTKEQIYLFLHSGDFFVLGDDHRDDGVLKLEWLEGIEPAELLTYLKENVTDTHICQFRHTITESVWRILSETSNENRFEKLTHSV